MDTTRYKSSAICGLSLGICLTVVASAGPLCAPARAQETSADSQKQTPEERAKKLAEEAVGTVMKLNKQVGAALSIVRGIVSEDPFAVINALIGLMANDGEDPDITVRAAKTEIINGMHKEREEALTNRVDALVEWFGELIANPQNMTYEGRLEDYLNEALALTVDLHAIMTSTDPLRAEMAYHLAPAYNTAVSSRLVGLATAKYAQESIDHVIVDAINTNMSLVSDEDQWGGYLYNFVQKQAGPYVCGVTFIGAHTSMPTDGGVQYEMDLEKGWVSTAGAFEVNPPVALKCDDDAAVQQFLNARFDADPTVYMVRRAVTDQELSLLPQ